MTDICQNNLVFSFNLVELVGEYIDDVEVGDEHAEPEREEIIAIRDRLTEDR